MINLSKSIEKSISLRKKIFFLEKDINKSINLIYKTIKSKKNFNMWQWWFCSRSSTFCS